MVTIETNDGHDTNLAFKRLTKLYGSRGLKTIAVASRGKEGMPNLGDWLWSSGPHSLLEVIRLGYPIIIDGYERAGDESVMQCKRQADAAETIDPSQPIFHCYTKRSATSSLYWSDLLPFPL